MDGQNSLLFDRQAANTRRRILQGHDFEPAIYNGEWRTPAGVLATPAEAYAGLGGGIDVLVLHWRGEAQVGLQAIHCARRPESR